MDALAPPLPTLPFSGAFIATLDWGVRGAALQWGGVITAADGAGAMVYRARLGSKLIFVAIALAKFAPAYLVLSTGDEMFRWTQKLLAAMLVIVAMSGKA